MNKWQLIVLGIMVVAICIVVFTAPKYVLVPARQSGDSYWPPFRIYSGKQNYDTLKSQYGSNIEWDTVAYISIPVLLIGGFLVLALRKKKV